MSFFSCPCLSVSLTKPLHLQQINKLKGEVPVSRRTHKHTEHLGIFKQGNGLVILSKLNFNFKKLFTSTSCDLNVEQKTTCLPCNYGVFESHLQQNKCCKRTITIAVTLKGMLGSKTPLW